MAKTIRTKAIMTALLVLLPLISASCGQTHNGNLNSAEDSDGNDGVLNPTESFFSAVVENTENTSDIPVGIEFDEDKYIDFFADVNDWLKYNGGDGYGIASLEIPEDYVREIGDGCYLRYYNKKQLNVISNNQSITIIGYSVDHGRNLTEGDIFEVHIGVIDFGSFSSIYNIYDELAKIEKQPFEISRNYVYPYTGDYITSSDEITDAHIEAAKNYVFEQFAEFDEFVAEFGEFEIMEIDIGTIKPAGITAVIDSTLLYRVFIAVDGYLPFKNQYYTVYLSGLAIDDGEILIQNITKKTIRLFNESIPFAEQLPFDVINNYDIEIITIN